MSQETENPFDSRLVHIGRSILRLNQDIDPEEDLQTMRYVSRVIEGDLEIHLTKERTTSSPISSVVLPLSSHPGSILMELGIFIAGVTTPLWAFLRDYESVKSGLRSFSGDLQNLLERKKPESNSVALDRVEPIVSEAIKDERSVRQGHPLFEKVWESEDLKLVENPHISQFIDPIRERDNRILTEIQREEQSIPQ